MLVREIMTADPVCVLPTDTVRTAARWMLDSHCGSLPVIRDAESRLVTGIVTDRDLAIRIVATGKSADTPVGEVMSHGVSCCFADSPVEEVEEIMAQRQVRRVPVVARDGACVGIVALGDIARAAATRRAIQDAALGRTLEQVSEKTEAPRSDVDIGVHPTHLATATSPQA